MTVNYKEYPLMFKRKVCSVGSISSVRCSLMSLSFQSWVSVWLYIDENSNLKKGGLPMILARKYSSAD